MLHKRYKLFNVQVNTTEDIRYNTALKECKEIIFHYINQFFITSFALIYIRKFNTQLIRCLHNYTKAYYCKDCRHKFRLYKNKAICERRRNL